MAKNENISGLDYHQLAKRAFDAEHDAQRVIMAADSETSIEISHLDNDSVYTMSKQESSNQSLSIVDKRRVCVYANNLSEAPIAIQVRVQPTAESSELFVVYSMNCPVGKSVSDVIEVCGNQVVVDAVPNLDVIVVGQS
jgi:hypothetical protein